MPLALADFKFGFLVLVGFLSTTSFSSWGVTVCDINEMLPGSLARRTSYLTYFEWLAVYINGL